jgi:type IV pilus assembly protein PilP
MNTQRRLAICASLLSVVAFGLSACSSGDDELQRFIEDTKKESGGRVEPLPEVKPYQTFTYSAAQMRSPFMPSGPSGGPNGPNVRPDSKRNR